MISNPLDRRLRLLENKVVKKNSKQRKEVTGWRKNVIGIGKSEHGLSAGMRFSVHRLKKILVTTTDKA
jgi:hypothetical protein